MTNKRQNSNTDSKYNPYDFEHNHGIGFLSMVLWELGHPKEPDETLLEVLKAVQQETGARIISFDDAEVIINETDEIDFIIHRDQLRERQSRIEAREERQKKENEADIVKLPSG